MSKQGANTPMTTVKRLPKAHRQEQGMPKLGARYAYNNSSMAQNSSSRAAPPPPGGAPQSRMAPPPPGQ